MQNSLDPKLNLLYNIPSLSTFTSSSFVQKDQYLLFTYLEKLLINASIEKYSLTQNDEIIKLLNLLGVQYLVSPYKLSYENKIGFKEVYSVLNNKSGSVIYVYKLLEAQDGIYFPGHIVYYRNFADFRRKVKENSYRDIAFVDYKSAQLNVFREILGKKENKEILMDSFTSLVNTPYKYSLNVNKRESGLVVFPLSFSPYWRATIDKKPVFLLKTNWMKQSVFVPAGQHTVSLIYDFPLFEHAIFIAKISYLIIGLAIFVFALLLIFDRKSHNSTEVFPD